jgi:hypothetical protein
MTKQISSILSFEPHGTPVKTEHASVILKTPIVPSEFGDSDEKAWLFFSQLLARSDYERECRIARSAKKG